ncbi:MAG: hypothetical protein M3252_04760 [Actinomycetota bacterium]|nr:hypothetical protein [Actinomycetota bacterium]
MPRKPAIPEGEARRTAWARLNSADRRRILRSVNRAQALADPHEAALAVGLAQNQQRFWRKGWIVGPVAAVLLFASSGWAALALNVAMAAVLFGLMAYLFYRRARRAEVANRQVVQAARVEHLPSARGPSRPPAKSRRKRKGRR